MVQLGHMYLLLLKINNLFIKTNMQNFTIEQLADASKQTGVYVSDIFSDLADVFGGKDKVCISSK